MLDINFDPPKLVQYAPDMLQAIEAALAILSQNKTFPADIKFAKEVLRNAAEKARGRK